MNQKVAWGAVIGGVLLAIGGEILKITEWSAVQSPAFVGALLVQFGGLAAAVFGAINVEVRK